MYKQSYISNIKYVNFIIVHLMQGAKKEVSLLAFHQDGFLYGNCTVL